MARFMRKVRVGAVVRTNQDKTAIVEMVWKQRHRLYRKQMRRVARFYVHDPENQCRLGDTVRIEETRRISKNKHWRLMEILERKQIAEVRPIDVETDVSLEMTQPRVLAAEVRAEAAASEAVNEEPAGEEPEAAEEEIEEGTVAEEEPEEEAAEQPEEEPAEEEPEPAEEELEPAGEGAEAEVEEESEAEEPEADEPDAEDAEAEDDPDAGEPDEQEDKE
ncbi:MAG: 30S ribosomal protein S17 [SAR202 cluster bacterium MP-SAtl-SRR3965592-G1]|nr:MAG: 30S ribosomal protein S17 [SAR202 cluster bacterium MP-SAtl-SRR3965592-G1]